ncbi:hypothetical protein ABT317_31215, partial [Streptomyces carpinensis]
AQAAARVTSASALRRCVRRDDRLGVLVTVELYGLLVCPVSWSHHWIWCVPAMIWLAHGPCRRGPLSRVALALWALVTVTRLVPRLIGAEDRLAHPSPYPQVLAWPGSVYAVCAVLTFLALALEPARAEKRTGVPDPERSRSRPHPAVLS